MSFYSEMAEMAREQIDEYGRLAIIRGTTGNTYNPSTDTNSGGTITETSVKMLFTEYRAKEIDGTIILRGDKKVMIANAALNTPPMHNDIVIDGTNEYKVIDISTIQPGDTPLIYKLQVRK